jgi:gas vesicle structural protein
LVLSDLISRVLDKGVVLSGEVIISIADIDLIKVELHLLVAGIQATLRRESNVPVLPDSPGSA